MKEDRQRLLGYDVSCLSTVLDFFDAPLLYQCY